MDQAASILQTALGQAMGSVLGAVIVFAGISLLVLVLAMPLYVLLRRRTPGGAQVSFQIGASRVLPGQPIATPIPGQPDLGRPDNWEQQAGAQSGDDRRQQLLHNLDVVERGVSRFYVVLLCFIMAAITGIAVFFYIKIPNDGNRDFLILYGGVVCLIGILWAASQLFRTMRRLSPPPDMLSGLRSKINVTYQMSPQVQFVDNQALDRAQQHLNTGGTIEEACAVMDPRYRSMNGMMQKLLQAAVQAAVDERRKTQH
jgi:hypothetical protein